jgi:hypothetical protein
MAEIGIYFQVYYWCVFEYFDMKLGAMCGILGYMLSVLVRLLHSTVMCQCIVFCTVECLVYIPITNYLLLVQKNYNRLRVVQLSIYGYGQWVITIGTCYSGKSSYPMMKIGNYTDQLHTK